LLSFSIFTGCTRKAGKPNVVLLVIDTLRADYLPMYGGKETVAPFLEKLSSGGALFSNSFSASSWTAPSTASILTSLFPIQHGILMGRRATKKLATKDPKILLNKLPQSVTTIAEVMKANGFATYGAVDNGNLRADSGFAQGFDKFVTYLSQGGKNLNKQIQDWAPEIKKSGRYFLYMQYMDPHHPYEEHKPWFKGDNLHGLRRFEEAYRSEISFTDSMIKELYELMGWGSNTIVLITSDHGEEFGDHGSGGHGRTLYGELVRVPLIIYYPDGGFSGKVVSEYVSSVDIVPTLASLAGINLTTPHEGINLVPVIKGEKSLTGREIYNHLWKRQKAGTVLELKGLAKDKKRLIESNKKGKKLFFDIENDRHERKNIANKNTELVTEYSQRIAKFETGLKTYDREWMPVPLDEEEGDD